MTTHTAASCRRGALISIEGVNGVGKTYLTKRLLPTLDEFDPLVLEEFSARDGAGDLGRRLLTALKSTSKGDFFLRGGAPVAEALILASIKMIDLDQALPALAEGRLVIEGRGLHTTAVYQAAIQHPGNRLRSLAGARQLLSAFAAWRALPDLTILITDHPDAAIHRAEEREGNLTLRGAERAIVHQVAWLYEQMGEDDPARVKVLDRSILDPDAAIAAMRAWIVALDSDSFSCVAAPLGPGAARVCTRRCGRVQTAYVMPEVG